MILYEVYDMQFIMMIIFIVIYIRNIFSYTYRNSEIGDLGLCQQLKDDKNEIFGVIPYLAPEVLSSKSYTKESDIYSFGMVMWEHTTGKKPFHDRSHNHHLIQDILE